MLNRISYITICCVYLLVTVLGLDCPYKECHCNDVFISCDGRGLQTVPPLLTQSYQPLAYLQFDMNQITTIPAGSLPSNLSMISFNHNPITTIDDEAFAGSATTLQSLTFTLAQFSRIPDAMLHLKTLRNLEISDSFLKDWNEDVMKNLGLSLQTLLLFNVNLTTWPNWTQYFGHMTELGMVECSVTTIPDNALDAMTKSLTSLTLTGNSLTVVPKALSILTALQKLYIDQNKITDTTWLPQARNLIYLTLNNNNIFNASQLSQALRHYAVFLRNFYIMNNYLTAIPDVHFMAFQMLDLSYNMISDTFSGSLPPMLQILQLGHNLLPSIPSAISNLTSLTQLLIPSNTIKVIQGTKLPTSVIFLDLSYNLITELTDTSFPLSSNLQTLFLNNNPIIAVSMLAFQNLQNLIELNLGNTRLTRLPLALSSLKKLDMLDISGIQGLVCTCMEKSLGPWILSLSPEKVWGDCGIMSIHDFFWSLSQNCPD